MSICRIPVYGHMTNILAGRSNMTAILLQRYRRSWIDWLIIWNLWPKPACDITNLNFTRVGINCWIGTREVFASNAETPTLQVHHLHSQLIQCKITAWLLLKLLFVCEKHGTSLFLYSVPICEEPPLANGMYAGQHDGPVYQQGEAITAICDPGYLLNGPTERQCIADGVWSGMDSTCDQGQWNAPFLSVTCNMIVD